MNGYSNKIDELLIPKISEEAIVLDLFAGCGGLSLGFEAAGFRTVGYEMVEAAVDTYNKNLHGVCHNQFLEVGFEYPDMDKIDIVVGGPPCQPFSRFGNQMGIEDARDGFPVFIDAVRRIRPRVFLFENVANILGRHKWYLDLIVAELRKIGYLVEYKVLNAVDYGVPQNRERLICVGHRAAFRFPKVEEKRVTVEEAIGDLMYRFDENSKFLTPRQEQYIAAYEAKSHCVTPRDLHPQRPARTITCRNLAGATSDMQRVRLLDGRRRRIEVREAARLQSFPDWFEFCGNESRQFNQIGNAVPPLFAYRIAQALKNTYKMSTRLVEEIRTVNSFQEQLLFQDVCT